MVAETTANNSETRKMNALINTQDEPTCTPIDTPAPDWKAGVDYGTSALVRYGGRLYSCRQGHRSQTGWEPPIVPALWATPIPCGVTEWMVQTTYTVGSKVTYQQQNYQCQQSHTSLEGWSPPATPALWVKVQLIRSILLSKSNVQFGESVRVAVRLAQPEGFRVFINGVPGSVQWFQFYDFEGIHTVVVTVYRRGDFFESRSVDIVVENPKDPFAKLKFPFIGISSPDSAAGHFEVVNFADVKAPGAVFTWDFGRGGSQTTTDSSVIQSLDDSLGIDEPYATIDVRITVTYPDQTSFTAVRSVLVWNNYYLEKARGFIKPKLDYNFRAVRENKRLVASCRIKNIEPEELRLTSKVIQYLEQDSNSTQSFNREEGITVHIPGNAEVNVDCSIPTPVPRGLFGYAVHFAGRTVSGKVVRTSCYFENRDGAQGIGMRIITDSNAVKALHNMRNQRLHQGRTFFTRDEVIRHIGRLESAEVGANMKTLRHTIVEGTEEIPDIRAFGGEDLLGKPCLPDEESPEEGMACQLTEEWAWVTIPARIVNAFKGDAILSSAGNGVIGGLLRQVDPPQAYSHSGIMTKNHSEIRHSTASEDRLQDHLAGSILGEGGTDGIDPDTLKYLWPGPITQSVQGAFNGEDILDVNGGKSYRISAFDYRTRQDQAPKLVPALIVKPDPFKEALIPSVRTTLHKVADAALGIKGHYRFYAYTDSSISSGTSSYNAPDRGPSWWASGSVPTVCSSMIWAAAKSVQNPRIQLEGAGEITDPLELEPADVAAGARVDGKTIDGLYLYSAEERRTAAEWLYNYFYNVASDKIHAKIPVLPASWVGDAPDDLGNQMVNAFASDWTGDDGDGRGHSKDSDVWKKTNEGHAVSPDNILFWDAPGQIIDGVQQGLYGYTEKLVYRPESYEYRQISRWVLVKVTGTVTGTVTYNGAAVGGATVSVGASTTVTALDGSFTITDVAAGTFEIKAGKLISGVYIEGVQPVSVAANATVNVAIALRDPPDFDREIVLSGSLYMHDDETFSDDNHTYQLYYDGIFLGPFGTHAEQPHRQGHGGELRVELDVKMDWKFPGDVEGSVHVKFFEGASEDTNDLEDEKTVSFRVAKGATERVTVKVNNSGFGGGDSAELNLDVSNKLRP